MFLGTPSEFVGKTLLRVLRASVGYLFLSKSQHGDTEITESTRADSIFPTDLSEVFMRLIVSTITRASGLATQLFGNTIVRTPPGHYRNQQTVAGLLYFVFSANRRLPSVGQNNSCTSLQ